MSHTNQDTTRLNPCSEASTSDDVLNLSSQPKTAKANVERVRERHTHGSTSAISEGFKTSFSQHKLFEKFNLDMCKVSKNKLSTCRQGGASHIWFKRD
jgi:hypothetical protein